jgi:hypothetical protein
MLHSSAVTASLLTILEGCQRAAEVLFKALFIDCKVPECYCGAVDEVQGVFETNAQALRPCLC